jgi:uncharacterized protein YbjT (DUF2867 family)
MAMLLLIIGLMMLLAMTFSVLGKAAQQRVGLWGYFRCHHLVPGVGELLLVVNRRSLKVSIAVSQRRRASGGSVRLAPKPRSAHAWPSFVSNQSMSPTTKPLSIVMLGATGAVGSEVLRTLLNFDQHASARCTLSKLTLLGRRTVTNIDHASVQQYTVDIFDASGYQQHLSGHDIAICTLGVGEPSKVSRDEFIRVDHDAVLRFARACKAAGVRDFHLLASVDADSHSRSFYLRTKGELCDALVQLGFARLSIAAPSMILTPQNRYGFFQGVLLRVFPYLNPVLLGSWQRYRGIAVQELGKAMALNAAQEKIGVELLHWADFKRLLST